MNVLDGSIAEFTVTRTHTDTAGTRVVLSGSRHSRSIYPYQLGAPIDPCQVYNSTATAASQSARVSAVKP